MAERLYSTVGCLFLRATNFANGLKFKETIFTNVATLVSSFQSIISVTIEFPLIFGETSFMEVAKIHKTCSPQKRCPTVADSPKT